LINNLSTPTQKHFLLNHLKESMNLALISAPTLDQNMRFNDDLIFSATQTTPPFSSFNKQINHNNNMIIHLLNIFNNHNDLQPYDIQREFFSTSLLAIEAYQQEHIDDINNMDLIKTFEKETELFIKGIYNLLKSLRDMDGIKDESTTRKFFRELKSISINTGFREMALDHKKLLPILMPLFVASKVKTKPRITM
jgi:hypothetical protein